jgi:hypothetical protein
MGGMSAKRQELLSVATVTWPNVNVATSLKT